MRPKTPPRAPLVVFLLILAPAGLRAEVMGGDSEARKIRDNLFLLEEAYNQEPGVIQHIQTFQRGDGDWSYSFTEEWPAGGERHQLSLTAPIVKGAAGSGAEWGDVLANYRLQALSREKVAFAPRLSLLLPTGNERAGAGRGGVGFQGNLPLSLDVHRQWVLHLNAGLTYVPRALDVEANTRWTAVDTAVGAALVWLPTYRVNALVEALHQSSAAGASAPRESSFILNPGLRVAIDFKSGLQIAPGLSVPIEFRDGSRRTSAFLYLSFEHPLSR